MSNRFKLSASEAADLLGVSEHELRPFHFFMNGPLPKKGDVYDKPLLGMENWKAVLASQEAAFERVISASGHLSKGLLSDEDAKNSGALFGVSVYSHPKGSVVSQVFANIGAWEHQEVFWDAFDRALRSRVGEFDVDALFNAPSVKEIFDTTTNPEADRYKRAVNARKAFVKELNRASTQTTLTAKGMPRLRKLTMASLESLSADDLVETLAAVAITELDPHAIYEWDKSLYYALESGIKEHEFRERFDSLLDSHGLDRELLRAVFLLVAAVKAEPTFENIKFISDHPVLAVCRYRSAEGAKFNPVESELLRYFGLAGVYTSETPGGDLVEADALAGKPEDDDLSTILGRFRHLYRLSQKQPEISETHIKLFNDLPKELRIFLVRQPGARQKWVHSLLLKSTPHIKG